MRPARVVEGHRLGKEPERLGVGVVPERLLSGPAEVVERPFRLACAAPVMREERDERLQVGRVRLVPLGDGAVERAALGVDQQVVCDLLGDDVGEQVGEVRVGRLDAGQVEPRRMVEVGRQERSRIVDRVDVTQGHDPEQAADHARHLERQLLRR